MRTSELKKRLSAFGCYQSGHGKRHDVWFSPATDNKLYIPRHDSQEIAIGTAKAIMKKAGI